MGISLVEATTALLKGASLSWPKFEDHKAGSIRLDSPGQRRLCRFLLKQPAARLTAPDESFFNGLIETWNDSADPASEIASGGATPASGVWRLARLEASGFGGLTIFGGPVFNIWIGGENWCLEGQNGSGKTSFTNAILWALTGQRLREQEGLVLDEGARTPVYSDTGVPIGTWPSLISYPEKVSDLKGEAKVWVRLTFKNAAHETAVAYRETTSPLEGNPQTIAQVDSCLLAVPQLIETGLLMPARISRIGFGKKSESLYEAVKLLTGLDQLADVAEAARLVAHGAQPFLKYAKQNGIEQEVKRFNDSIAKAEEQAASTGVDVSKLRTLGQNDLGIALAKLAKDASTKAGEHLATLKAEIAEGLDTAKSEVRNVIKQAVANARAILNQGEKTIPVFEAWMALTGAEADANFKALCGICRLRQRSNIWGFYPTLRFEPKLLRVYASYASSGRAGQA